MNAKFIQLIQNGLTEINTQLLKNMYDEFAVSVLTGKDNFFDNSSYHNALVYTKVELSCLKQSLEKKQE